MNFFTSARLLLFFLLAIPACVHAKPSLPSDGSIRPMCFTAPDSMQQVCGTLPYATAAQVSAALLPQPVEIAFQDGYGQIEVSMQTTAGPIEKAYCGGFLVDEKRKLVITSHHCIPGYLTMLTSKNITFRQIPAVYVGSVVEADLALLQLESLPGEMHQLRVKEAVVGEASYGRSAQVIQIGDPASTKTQADTQFFTGLVSFYGTVASKGTIGVTRFASGGDGKLATSDITITSYEMLRLNGQLEPGFSGSPIFNQWGEVIGTATAGGTTNYSYATSASNYEALLKKYAGK